MPLGTLPSTNRLRNPARNLHQVEKLNSKPFQNCAWAGRQVRNTLAGQRQTHLGAPRAARRMLHILSYIMHHHIVIIHHHISSNVIIYQHISSYIIIDHDMWSYDVIHHHFEIVAWVRPAKARFWNGFVFGFVDHFRMVQSAFGVSRLSSAAFLTLDKNPSLDAGWLAGWLVGCWLACWLAGVLRIY